MLTKKMIYAAHNIEMIKAGNTEKLVSPMGVVNKPLVNGNKKIGRGCYHFSTLPGTQLFDTLPNANIVKSIIPGVGFNFGHIDFVQDTFNKLQAAGKTVHVCRCGVDKDQHCSNCKGCSENEFVLFVEHSTEYKAEKESNWEAFKRFVGAVSPAKLEKVAC